MRAGRLLDKIRLEQPDKQRNPVTGATTNVWKLVVKRSANIMPLAAHDKNSQGADLLETDTLIHLRYDSALKLINGEWRIVDDRTERVYEIKSFDPVKAGMKDIKIRCVHRSK